MVCTNPVQLLLEVVHRAEGLSDLRISEIVSVLSLVSASTPVETFSEGSHRICQSAQPSNQRSADSSEIALR